MAQQLRVFVSHSHEDDAFCRAVVAGLRGAGADVWYDEHNLGSGQLMPVIQRELGERPIVILILSKAAFASHIVRDEIVWAYKLVVANPSRLVLAITADPISPDDFMSLEGGLLMVDDIKRIGGSSYQPIPADDAVPLLLRALALTSIESGVKENADDRLVRGKALIVQQRYAEALTLLKSATQLSPFAFDAWANLGYVLNKLRRYSEALPAYMRALDLDPYSAATWCNLGITLHRLKRNDEALAAYNQALHLDPDFAGLWYNSGSTLRDLNRFDEALAVLDKSLALDPTLVDAWFVKGDVLHRLGRYEDAIAAFNRAAVCDTVRVGTLMNSAPHFASLRQRPAHRRDARQGAIPSAPSLE